MRIAAILSLLLGLTACVDAPALRDTVEPEVANANYPTLVPVEQILGTNRPDPEADQRVVDTLTGRVAGLQARAKRLKASGIDDATRKRLDEGTQSD